MGKQSAFTNMAGLSYLFLGGVLASIHWRLPFLLYLWPIVLLPAVVLSMRAQPLSNKSETPAVAGEFAAFLRGSSLPTALLVCLLGSASMMFIYTLFTVHPFRMQELGFGDPRLISYTIMIATVSSAMAGWNLRRLSMRLSPYAVFAFTFLMFGIGFSIVSVASEIWHVFGGNFVMGIGMGLPVPNGAAWLSSISPEPVRSRVLGIFNTFIFMGQFLSILLLRMMGSFTPHIYHVNLALGVTCIAVTCLLLAGSKYLNLATGGNAG